MKQLDKKAVWIFFFNSFFGVLTLLPFLLVLNFVFISSVFQGMGSYITGGMVAVFVLIVAVLFGLAFLWAKLSYHYYRYELTDLGFRKESGVIWKRYVTIPYARIQNVDINRGLLARILGLSDLQIQTAGASASFSRYGVSGAGAEGRLPGVSKADAEVLRDELVRRANMPAGMAGV